MTHSRKQITVQAPTTLGKTTSPARLIIAGTDYAGPRFEIVVDDWTPEIMPFSSNRKARRARKSIARRKS